MFESLCGYLFLIDRKIGFRIGHSNVCFVTPFLLLNLRSESVTHNFWTIGCEQWMKDKTNAIDDTSCIVISLLTCTTIHIFSTSLLLKTSAICVPARYALARELRAPSKALRCFSLGSSCLSVFERRSRHRRQSRIHRSRSRQLRLG